MKKITLFAVIAITLFSCSKQTDLRPEKPSAMDEFIKAKAILAIKAYNSEIATKKGGNGKPNQALLNDFSASSSGDDHVEWTSPNLLPGNKYTWVEVDGLSDSVGTLIKTFGGSMKYVNSITPVNNYVQGDWNQSLPAGTWTARVLVYQATPNPLAGQWNGTYYEPEYIPSSWIENRSNDVPGVTFH